MTHITLTTTPKTARLILTNKKGTTMKVEIWDTRFGTSVRVVARRGNGRFINNKSDRQIVNVILALDDLGLYSKPTKVYSGKRPKVNLKKG